MRFKSYLTLFFVGILFVGPLTLKAQNQDHSEVPERYGLKYRMFRFALVPGLSTNGFDATNYVSKYSLNILGGYNGALYKGFELGGLFNGNKHYASGVQIAGLANYSGKGTTGIQLAGLGSYSGDEMQGIQLGGLGNISAEDMQGLQLSGVFNIANGYAQGLQSSGAVNLARDGMQGLFAAGLGNVSGGSIQGLFFAGGVNIAKSDMQGIIASGVLNYAENIQGISLSTLNVSDEFQGIQAGVANIAKDAEGIQIGVINYANRLDGVPVGLVSYYKENGRNNIDVWTSDAGFTNVGVKLGTHKIYNMISIGYNTFLDRDVWQVGWSIGRLHNYTHHFLYTDFSYFKVNEGGWTNDLNSIFKYRLLFGKDFADYFKLYGGPTINMLISKVPQSNDYTWYRLLDFGAKQRSYVFWIGFSFGIQLL
ncbi:MAG TPA: hypothetical protein VJ964_08150 [Balneolaceae bacterium]|nr:hypothetical protein [Balneolaceae bacterium]